MYYVILDLEMCKVPGGLARTKYHRGNETIQIGAVLMNDRFDIVDEYMSYVKPEYGRIDSFIRNLTGITAENLADAPGFGEAIRDFASWIPEDDVTIVSWSMTDKYQMRHDLEIRALENEKLTSLFETWTDCQKIFDDRMEYTHPTSLESALNLTDVITDRRSHNGLDDAFNTALLYKKLCTESELKLNKYYERMKSGSEDRLTYSLGDLMAALNFSA